MANKKIKRAMLVYQAGIANVFAVDCFNLATFGREAKRLLQSDFHTCLSYASGLGASGIIVRTAHCNKAGDIIDQTWYDDLENALFSDKIVDLKLN